MFLFLSLVTPYSAHVREPSVGELAGVKWKTIGVSEDKSRTSATSAATALFDVLGKHFNFSQALGK